MSGPTAYTKTDDKLEAYLSQLTEAAKRGEVMCIANVCIMTDGRAAGAILGNAPPQVLLSQIDKMKRVIKRT